MSSCAKEQNWQQNRRHFIKWFPEHTITESELSNSWMFHFIKFQHSGINTNHGSSFQFVLTEIEKSTHSVQNNPEFIDYFKKPLHWHENLRKYVDVGTHTRPPLVSAITYMYCYAILDKLIKALTSTISFLVRTGAMFRKKREKVLWRALGFGSSSISSGLGSFSSSATEKGNHNFTFCMKIKNWCSCK